MDTCNVQIDVSQENRIDWENSDGRRDQDIGMGIDRDMEADMVGIAVEDSAHAHAEDSHAHLAEPSSVVDGVQVQVEVCVALVLVRS